MAGLGWGEMGAVDWAQRGLHLTSASADAVIHTVKGFGIVNKAEMDVFLPLQGA